MRTSTGIAAHLVITATSGADTAKPTTPPADRMAGSPADSSGVPDATCTRPRTPASSAVQPMTIRAVSALLSGWRRNRQASSASKRGMVQVPDPNSVTSPVASGLIGPARVPPGRHRRDDRGAQRGKARAVPAMERVEVTSTAAESTSRRCRPCGRAPSRSRRPRSRPSPPGSRTDWSKARAECCVGPLICPGYSDASGSCCTQHHGGCARRSQTRDESNWPAVETDWSCRREGALRLWAHESP